MATAVAGLLGDGSRALHGLASAASNARVLGCAILDDIGAIASRRALYTDALPLLTALPSDPCWPARVSPPWRAARRGHARRRAAFISTPWA